MNWGFSFMQQSGCEAAPGPAGFDGCTMRSNRAPSPAPQSTGMTTVTERCHGGHTTTRATTRACCQTRAEQTTCGRSLLAHAAAAHLHDRGDQDPVRVLLLQALQLSEHRLERAVTVAARTHTSCDRTCLTAAADRVVCSERGSSRAIPVPGVYVPNARGGIAIGQVAVCSNAARGTTAVLLNVYGHEQGWAGIPQGRTAGAGCLALASRPSGGSGGHHVISGGLWAPHRHLP